ncbi:MAG: peptidase [Sphingobacteriaceae bacterium]|jgi:murein DD-endopeptidase MepM/ murein hydrolase activator NlpD|nr:peptidase [Sphingobacteriaceae bacterium]
MKNYFFKVESICSFRGSNTVPAKSMRPFMKWPIMLGCAMVIYSGCKQDSVKQQEVSASTKNQASVSNLAEDAVSIASATVYSAASGGTAIGSIGVNENLDAGTVSGTRTYVTYKTTGEDKSGWVASSAVRLTSWMWPIQAVNTTQDFNDYYADKGGYHLAIDMTSSVGIDNIFAARGGTVVYAGYSSCNGNHVIIQHLNGTNPTVYTLYCHMTSINASITNGAQVTKGQTIGQMGSTGCVTGKHLHFSIYSRNYSTDPYGYTSSGGTTVSRSDSKIVMSYSSGNVTYYDPQYVVRNSGQLP